MVLEPSMGRPAAMAGRVVGDDPDFPGRVGTFDLLQESLPEDAVAGGSRQVKGLPVRRSHTTVAPGVLRSAAVVERGFDPLAVGRPGKCGRDIRRISGSSPSTQMTVPSSCGWP